MPAKYAVRYLPAAEEDLLSILEYIAKDNPRRAEAFVDKLDMRIRILETFPFAGRIPLHQYLKGIWIPRSDYRILPCLLQACASHDPNTSCRPQHTEHQSAY
jgi:plasmid stabilization system protein ParE